MPRTLFSVADPFFPHASAELMSVADRRTARIERLGTDLGCIDDEYLTIADLADACLARPLVFIRHLAREVVRIPVTDSPAFLQDFPPLLIEQVQQHHLDTSLALQSWVSGTSSLVAITHQQITQSAIQALHDAGYTVARGQQEHTISLCLAEDHLVIGINRREYALSDWAGGRVALAHQSGRISRSEFKLEELFKIFPLTIPDGGLAADLGASPGGWTHILVQQGMHVQAIDPADLDPRIGRRQEVRHIRQTARQFLTTTQETFALIVNDMRMDALPSCDIMLDAVHLLQPGGMIILTLKLLEETASADVRDALRLLEQRYTIMFARQLFHNRSEVTVVARRKHPPRS